ncbi:g9898 [Coccomyxa viridis]|uniref:G9898 protein n=1 Tax=Coccomyxa viridis TaxID=1274662 RepID=A0ABP1G4E8_9CHLO
MSKFAQGLSKLKLKEVPTYVQEHAGKHWTPAQVTSRTSKFLHSYKEKYIDTGSIKPLTDTMIGLFFLSYAVAWPQEYAHMKAEEKAKLEGKAAH